ncbi:MAG TPA: hypothetical protein VFN61_10050, partial [Acidimicrobiales bacterium]|nr:hypothetical protein [Acidimicrobiales bacterium]
TTLPLGKVQAADLARADLVVVGSWTEGLVVTRVHPAKAAVKWLERLPRMAGKPAAVFCTYAVAPKGTVTEMKAMLEAKGATVLATAAFGGHGEPTNIPVPDVHNFAKAIAEAVRSLSYA